MTLDILVTPSALTQFDDTPAPSAWLGHIPFGSWLVAAAEPKTLVELGTHYGNSYFAFCASILHNNIPAQCYAVDTWVGDPHAGFYGDEVYASVLKHNDSLYKRFSQLLRMTFDAAAETFSAGSIDFLHIDGLHTYQAVRHDFETWLPKLSERAIVLFHDTNVKYLDFGVWKLWDELSCRYSCIEFTHSSGLGVLLVGKHQPEVIQQLLNEWKLPTGRHLIQQYFSRLGNGIELEWKLSAANKALAERDSLTGAIQYLISKRFDQSSEFIARQFRRAKHVWPLIIPAIRKGGGITKAAKKAAKIYRREGIAGIKRVLKELEKGS